MKLKTKKIFILLIIFYIIMQCFSLNVYARSYNNQFKFEQSTYSLRGEHDDTPISIILPNGYTMNDVEIISENENIVQVFDFLGKYYIESVGIGETKLKAKIKSTNYIAYCKVKVEEPIIINVLKKEKGVTLEIDNYSAYLWSISTMQACEISITPLNNQGEEKWLRLGEDIFGRALNKKYYYDIDENCIVSVRWISWWNGNYYNGENEIIKKTIIINDLEPMSSIGSHLKIYANNYNEDTSIISVGETLELNAETIEMSNDVPITWKSYQDNVAIVDSNGTVTAIREGTARIEATATEILADGHTITYTDVYTIIVENQGKMSIQPIFKIMF